MDDQFSTDGGAPFDFSPTEVFFPVSAPAPKPDLSLFISRPVYSTSGFDLLSILARVASRPNPRVVLGPVDLTCAFVVVDLRRYDHPIVYCSPSFCTLTGYSEEEVIGKNCRFLQAPTGQVSKGELRRFTSQDAVAHLAKSVISNKECQTSIVNYKKNGDAFINLVTVIPVPGGVAGNVDEQDDIVFHVGFQVDLSEQPNGILERLSYVVDCSHPPLALHHSQQQQSRPALSRERKQNAIPPVVFSKELRRLLLDPDFLRSMPITTSTNLQSSTSVSTIEDTSITQLLNLLLLEASPDFIHVVSLKGSFLYVAPSVRRVLGYEPDEMVGTCIADYAHPEDVVPLMRELKESSVTGLPNVAPLLDPTNSCSVPSSGSALPGSPRSVDLLFRAKTKMGRYIWVECRGKLHVEPGKGRKAIILSGRAREMMNLKWEHIDSAGGLAMAVRVPSTTKVDAEVQGAGEDGDKGHRCYQDQEFWGILGGVDRDSARFLSVGKGVRDVLGWSSGDLLGKGLGGIVEESCQDVLGQGVGELRRYQKSYYARCIDGSYDNTNNLVDPRVRKVRCRLSTKCGSGVDVWFILYRVDPDLMDQKECVHETGGKGVSPAPLVYQIRRVDAQVVKCGPGMVDVLASSSSSSSLSSSSSAPSEQDLFEELDISRSSSWQYELQQLRFANIRLKEELKLLEAADEASEVEAKVVREREQDRFGGYLEMDEEQQSAILQQSSIHQYQHQHPHIRQQHPVQYSLPMPPPPQPLPVLASQPQVQMQVQVQTPDHLLDQQHSLKRQQYFRFLDDQEPPARSSLKRMMTGSAARIGTSTVGQPQQRTLQCLPQTQMNWRTIPTVPAPAPALIPTLTVVHRHQHQHQHQHQHYRNQSLDPGEAQRYGLKRSWNTMESA